MLSLLRLGGARATAPAPVSRFNRDLAYACGGFTPGYARYDSLNERSAAAFNGSPTSFNLGDELCGPEYPDAVPGVQRQQILVARNNRKGPCGQCQLQVAIVLGIPAVVDLVHRLNPECGRCQQFEDLATPVAGQNVRKLWPGQNLGDLSKDRL